MQYGSGERWHEDGHYSGLLRILTDCGKKLFLRQVVFALMLRKSLPEGRLESEEENTS